MSLATIAHYDTPALAHIAQAKLEAEGIDSAIVDENLVGWFWYYSVATGGIKLQVHEADVERAQDILRTRDEYVAKVSAPVETEPPRCPACQSEKVRRRRLFKWPISIISIILTLVVGLILGLIALASFSIMFILLMIGYWQLARWQCRDCGHQWKSG